MNIPVNREYKVTAKELLIEIERRSTAGEKPLKGLILSSPGNPTGAMFKAEELKDLCLVCEQKGILFISDEIYHGISYRDDDELQGMSTSTSSGEQLYKPRSREPTALQFLENSIVINSFSKYFSMTGWRLGWMVVPLSLVDAMNRLSQNLYINAPTLSQMAACHAFDPECEEELDRHVEKYAVNRNIVLETLRELEIDGNASPADGAFYVYVDLSEAGVSDSTALCKRLLEETGVALTSGVDFEDPSSHLGDVRVRFSYSRNTGEVREGMRRFKAWWTEHMKK